MSVIDVLTERLVSNMPPVIDPDQLARQCALALKKDWRNDIITMVVFGLLIIAGTMIGALNRDAAKAAGTLTMLSIGYFGRSFSKRERLRALMRLKYPEQSANSGLQDSASSNDRDIPPYARRK